MPPSRPWEGDDRVVLDVELLLVAGPVFAFDDEIGGRESRVQVAAPDVVAGEYLLTHERIEDRWERRGPQGDARAGLGERGAVWRGQEAHRFRVMADLAAERDERRLVVLDRGNEVLARDVRRGDDDDLRPVERGVEIDRVQPGARLGRADGRAVPGAREHQVVGVFRLAGQLPGTLAAEWLRRSHTTGHHRVRGHEQRCRRGGARGRRPDGHATRVMTARRPAASTTGRPRCPRRRPAPGGSPRIGRSRGRQPSRE